MEEQQTQPTRLLARDVMRADLFSPAAKARLAAALAMSQAERLGAFREAAFGWAKMWAPDATKEELQLPVSHMVACYHNAE